MAALSNWAEAAILDQLLRAVDITIPSGGLYCSLHTADVTDAGTGTEVSGTSYARVQVAPASWNAAASPGGTITTNADIVFPAAGGSWGTVTHIGFWTASTAGNLVIHGALAASKSVSTGDVFRIYAGNITITLA